MFFTVIFIDNISGEIVYLIYHKIPSPEIKIAYAKINTFNAKAGDNSLQAFCKLNIDIVVYLGHMLLYYCLLLVLSSTIPQRYHRPVTTLVNQPKM